MKTMILVILTAAITNNYVLVKFLGICPFLGVSKKLDQATGMSLAVIFVEVLATAVTWPIYHFLLAGKVDFTYMETVVFILSLRPLSSWSRSFSSAMCPRCINPSASICRSLRRTAACWA